MSTSRTVRLGIVGVAVFTAVFLAACAPPPGSPRRRPVAGQRCRSRRASRAQPAPHTVAAGRARFDVLLARRDRRLPGARAGRADREPGAGHRRAGRVGRDQRRADGDGGRLSRSRGHGHGRGWTSTGSCVPVGRWGPLKYMSTWLREDTGWRLVSRSLHAVPEAAGGDGALLAVGVGANVGVGHRPGSADDFADTVHRRAVAHSPASTSSGLLAQPEDTGAR